MKLSRLWSNLNFRLLGMFLLISLLLGGSISYFVHARAQQALHESVANRLSNISRLKEAELDRWGTAVKDKLESLAQRPLVREYITALMEGNLSPDEEGELIDNLLENHFLPALKSEGYFESFSVVRAEDGKIIFSMEEELVGKYREKMVFFQNGLLDTYLDFPRYEITEGRPVMHASTPILGPDGETIAVLAGHTDLNEFQVIASQLSESSRTQETYLVSQTNLMVTESRFEDDSAHNVFVYSEGVERCLAGDSGFGEYQDYRDVKVVGWYTWMPDWKLCLLTEQDQSEAYALSTELRRTTITIGSLVTLVAAAGGVLISRSITNPLKLITRGAEEFSRGNLDFQVELDSDDELGILARTFNAMRASLASTLEELQDLNQSLEERVEERTRELKDAQLATLNMMEDAHLDRQQAEENETRFRTLFEESPISLWEEDLSRVKEYLDDLKSDGVEDLMVYFEENPDQLEECTSLIRVLEVNLQSQNTFEAVSKEQLIERLEGSYLIRSKESILEKLVALYRGEIRYEAEVPYQTLKGKQIWANLVVSIPPGYEQNWEKVLISILDITSQKQAQQAMLAEKEFSEKIMNSIPGVFYVFDSEGRFIRWNDNFQQVTEYTPEEIRSLHPTKLFVGDEQELVAGRIMEVFSKGESSVMANFTSKSGRQTPYYLTGVQAAIDGEPILIGTGVDISVRVAAEQALEEKARDLARSNEDLERFAYVASHDLQEPLRMVASYLQLLERRYGDSLEEEAKEFMGFAVDGAARMKQLINDLLAFSRVGTRGGDFHRVNLNQVVGKVHSNLVDQIESSGAVITHDALPTLPADETQLLQLYQNLISNAIKFSKEGVSPTIHLGAAQENGYWQMSVTDNGIGFDPQFSERVFVLFQRLHSSQEYQGTGIGLAVSKRIVERHGGRIWVDSKPGEGTTFYFTLPEKQEKERNLGGFSVKENIN